MADLDILRPEVREAINRQDRQEKCDEYCPVCEDRATIRAELLRLAMIETDALIALDCEHDWQVMRERAEKAEAELAALKARIAEAPTAAARIVNDGRGGITRTYVCHESQSCIELPSLDGKRVRLVVEE